MKCLEQCLAHACTQQVLAFIINHIVSFKNHKIKVLKRGSKFKGKKDTWT